MDIRTNQQNKTRNHFISETVACEIHVLDK